MKISCFLLLFLLCFACEDDDDPIALKDADVILIEITDEVIPSDDYTITEARYDRECDLLVVTVVASGCDGDSWKVRLVTNGLLRFSEPPQGSAMLILDNPEDCEALIQRKFAFDLTPYFGTDAGFLDISGTDYQILIEGQ